MMINWRSDFFIIGFFSDRFMGLISSVPLENQGGIFLVQDTKRRILVS